MLSQNTDQTLRLFLANQGGGKKGDLWRFIEEAVKAYIFELSAVQAKTANINVDETDLLNVVTEAVTWARQQ